MLLDTHSAGHGVSRILPIARRVVMGVQDPAPGAAVRSSFNWKAFGLVCAFGLLVRVLVFAVNVHRDAPVILQQDSWGYIAPGDSLSKGRGYTDEETRPLGRWPPGYARFLALLFASGLASPTSLAVVVVAQIV